MEKIGYFISAFLEVESIRTNNQIANDLKKVGNLFATKEEAVSALQRIKNALKND